jgi:hypothetical protein
MMTPIRCCDIPERRGEQEKGTIPCFLQMPSTCYPKNEPIPLANSTSLLAAQYCILRRKPGHLEFANNIR